MDSELSLAPHVTRPIDPYSDPKLLASSPDNPSLNDDFFRSCALCADGSVAMIDCESRNIELYAIPSCFQPTESEGTLTLCPTRQFAQPASVLCTLWYPTATPADPSAFCFLAAVKECPIKLLDASDGRLRASYKIVDHRERYISPHSMSFNPNISKLYCGFQDAIEVFDVNYPGEGERIFTTPSKKSRSGLKGIISSLAFCSDYSGLYAAGTFSASVVLFSESSHAEVIKSIEGVTGPVTQVKFDPMRPHMLYATCRQTNSILAWDIRGDTSAPLRKFSRPGLTNQRINFDIDIYGKVMVTGDQNGSISCFAIDGDIPEKPSIKFQAHQDVVASTAIHPIEPMVVSVSGSRHFDEVLSDGSPSEAESPGGPKAQRRYRRRSPNSHDTTVKLWKFSAQEDVDVQAGYGFTKQVTCDK